MDIEMNYTAAAGAAMRKAGVMHDLSLQTGLAVPAIGDFVEIETANGRLVLRVLVRSFRFRAGVAQAQGIRLILDLHKDSTPGLQEVDG